MRSITIICVMLLTSMVQASIIRVPDDQPNIQLGINAAGIDDTVLVMSGTYTGDGNRDLTTAAKTVSIIGDKGADSTIIDCEDPLMHYGFAAISSNTLIKGLTITCSAPH